MNQWAFWILTTALSIHDRRVPPLAGAPKAGKRSHDESPQSAVGRMFQRARGAMSRGSVIVTGKGPQAGASGAHRGEARKG